MKSIFKNAKEWHEDSKNYLGLPRPFVLLHEYPKKRKRLGLAKKIPIPWQSRPIVGEDTEAFNVIYENENKVILNNLCGYCGIEILNHENVIRWKDTNFKVIDNEIEAGRVSSDIMPMHIECMRQARLFCPHMKKTKDEEFEYGDFFTLKQNGLKSIENKKNTPIN